MDSPITAASIYGSTRERRFCDTVTNWAANEISNRNDTILDLIDPGGLKLPPRHGRDDHAALADLWTGLGEVDAFVMPEYNHGYPASLKFLIASVCHPCQANAVAFLSYGGISGGLRAVEQLRLVFAELHAVTIRDCVSFANPWNRFDADGRLTGPEDARKAMATMLSRLRWWATILRDVRQAAPYSEVAA